MKCPYCQATESSVVDTTKDFNHGFIRRRRECDVCHQRYSTIERPIMTTPLLVKRDGTREEFDRENCWLDCVLLVPSVRFLRMRLIIWLMKSNLNYKNEVVPK